MQSRAHRRGSAHAPFLPSPPWAGAVTHAAHPFHLLFLHLHEPRAPSSSARSSMDERCARIELTVEWEDSGVQSGSRWTKWPSSGRVTENWRWYRTYVMERALCGAVRCARVGPVAAGDGQPIVLCYVALYLYDCAVQSSRVLWCRARRRRDEQLALAAAREGRIAHTPCPCASYGPLGRVCRTP
jgi:hypothetical protein